MTTKPFKPSPLDTGFITSPDVRAALTDDEDAPPEPRQKAPTAGANAAPPFATPDGRPVTPSGASGVAARVPSGGSPNDMIDDRSRPPPRLPPQVERSPFKFRK